MASKIICDVVTEEGATAWFGNLVVTNVRLEDGGLVMMNNFLCVKFKYPSSSATTVGAPGFSYTINPWTSISAELIANEAIDTKTAEATFKITSPQNHHFDSRTKLIWGVNGNLAGDTTMFTESFEFYADSLPSE